MKGEFDFIKDIRSLFPSPEGVCGIGDDCAVITQRDGAETLVSTDMMVEGVHFDMTYTPLKHLGYKAIAIGISDVAAMNALPKQVLVSIAVSNRFSVEALEELYAGMRLCCERSSDQPTI